MLCPRRDRASQAAPSHRPCARTVSVFRRPLLVVGAGRRRGDAVVGGQAQVLTRLAAARSLEGSFARAAHLHSHLTTAPPHHHPPTPQPWYAPAPPPRTASPS